MPDSKVAILKTSPETVLADYARLMDLAGARDELDPAVPTALKINISWHHFYPACSTTPWQMEGVVKGLLGSGYDRDYLYACQNRTVVVSARKGERANRHLGVVNRYGIDNVHLYNHDEEWVHIREAVGSLADDFIALGDIYPDGFRIPKRFLGSNIIQLPTVKTHVFTTMTGAMKNAFGGLLNERRHWSHERIHRTLVDLLRIQQTIHRGVFAVMDGTFAGDGPGPRCMEPHEKNVILASADQVAIDAVAASLMGYKPLQDIEFLRVAHEMGLGCADLDKIEIVGDEEAADERWDFTGPFRRMTAASRAQHAIYWGWLHGLLHWSLKTWLAPWSYLASIAYHDYYWYPLVGRVRVARSLHTKWGQLFRTYPES